MLYNMPKDWQKYKAEVHQLYIVEEKTVYQVRDILKSRHGFCASVRAYRMHFDEWGMKKYKATKSRSNTARSRHLSSPPTTRTIQTSARSTSTNDSTPQPDITMGDVRGESEPILELRRSSPAPYILSEALKSIGNDGDSSLSILDAILQHWQSNSEYANTLISYFRDPNFNKWVARPRGPDIPAIFKLIEDHVPEGDRFALTKVLLEVDLESRPDLDHYPTAFQESWYQACDSGELEDFRDDDPEGILSRIPEAFVNRALVVLAERLLTRYLSELEHWTGRPLDEDETEAKNECKKKYREILSQFHHAKEDVDAEFYRLSLKFDLQDASSNDTYSRDVPYEDDYRQKYIRLLSWRIRKPWEEQVGENGFGEARCRYLCCQEGSTADVQTAQPTLNGLPPTPPFSEDSKSPQPGAFPIQEIVNALIEKWRSLDGFVEYTSMLLQLDDKAINIFTRSARPESPNLFDGIAEVVTNKDEQISIVKAILVIASSAPLPDSAQKSWLLSFWRQRFPAPSTLLPPPPHHSTTASTSTSKFNSPTPTPQSPSQITYHNFHSQLLANPDLTSHINDTIATDPGRKLFLDAVISLVGERVLGDMKNGLRKEGKSLGRQKGYSAVIRAIMERGMKVDECWRQYLLNSL